MDIELGDGKLIPLHVLCLIEDENLFYGLTTGLKEEAESLI